MSIVQVSGLTVTLFGGHSFAATSVRARPRVGTSELRWSISFFIGRSIVSLLCGAVRAVVPYGYVLRGWSGLHSMYHAPLLALLIWNYIVRPYRLSC